MKPTKGVYIFMCLVALAAAFIWWNSRITETYEFAWPDSAQDARIHLKKPDGDQLLGTAHSANGALEILARRGWRPINTRRDGDQVIYLLTRTGLKSPGYITITAR